nr:calcium/sodium antiporter [uncultured Cohaesibacter sp.]
MEYLFVLVGLVCLFVGGEWLVKGAIGVSQKLGLPAFLISLTVVGFGTSMPELLVSLKAAIGHFPGIVLGNVVGSNIANILLIVGLAAMIAPIRLRAEICRRDSAVMLAATASLTVALSLHAINQWIGCAMLLSLTAYLVIAYLQDRKTGYSEYDAQRPSLSMVRIVALLAIGLVLLVAGADLLVRGATTVASDLGVSNAVIGLTVVAVGTSLPELATSMVAALHRRSDVAIGNVVGSNIFNILGILGLTSIVSPVPVADRFAYIDAWVMLGATVILFTLLMFSRIIGRIIGAFFLAAYAIYIISMA